MSTPRHVVSRSTSRTAVAAALALLLAAALGGCGAGTAEVTADAGGDTAPPPVGDGLVLRVDETGGFTTPTMLATRLPLVSVYADGRVLTPAPQVEIWPPPALPGLEVRRVDQAGVAELVRRARAAGVGADPDLGEPPVADAPYTRFTLVTGTGTEQVEALALGLGDPAADDAAALPGLTAEQQAARARLRDLLGALTDLEATLGASAVTAAEPYEPAAVAAVATPWTDPGPEAGDQPERPWPGPALPGTPLAPGLDLTCVTVTGPELAQLRTAAAQASAVTPWVSDGQRWSVALRPLLPDESGCADLTGRS